MVGTALFLGGSAYISEHYVNQAANSFIMNGEEHFSGLFVNADGFIHEGYTRSWLDSHDTSATATNTNDSSSTSTSSTGGSILQQSLTAEENAANMATNIGPFYMNYQNGYIDVDAGEKICNR